MIFFNNLIQSRWLHNGTLHSGPGLLPGTSGGNNRCAGLQLSHVPHSWVGRGLVRGSTHPVSASPSRLCNISQSSVVSSSTWRMPSINLPERRNNSFGCPLYSLPWIGLFYQLSTRTNSQSPKKPTSATLPWLLSHWRLLLREGGGFVSTRSCTCF